MLCQINICTRNKWLLTSNLRTLTKQSQLTERNILQIYMTRKLTWLGCRECVCRRISWSSIQAACYRRRLWQWCGRRIWSSWGGSSCSAMLDWWYTSHGHRATYRTEHTLGWRSPVRLWCTIRATIHQHLDLPLLRKKEHLSQNRHIRWCVAELVCSHNLQI